MRHIYFIDYENVGPKGLTGIENLQGTDEVYFFHYTGTGNIKYENLLNLAKSKSKTQVIKLSTHEKNAMDFQIVAMLGYLVGKYQDKARYHIVSRDKGYQSAIECINSSVNPDVVINTVCSVDGCNHEENEETIKKLLAGYNSKVVNRAIASFKEANSLQEMHELLQIRAKKDCNGIYKSLKPVFVAVNS